MATEDSDILALMQETRRLNAAVQGYDAKMTEIGVQLAAYGSIMSADVFASMKMQIETFASQGNLVLSRLTDVEQAMASARTGGGRIGEIRSFGQRFTDSDSVKAVMASRGGRTTAIDMGTDFRASVATVNSGVYPAAAGGGNIVIPQHIPGIITPQLRRFTVRDLLMGGQTTSNSIDFVQETGFQNMSAPTPENTQKPQSDIAFTRKSAPVRTIAHILIATKQILDDAPQLQSYIDGRMRYGLAFTEESQLLMGDGVGEDILGLVPQATAFSASYRVTGDTTVDTLRRAKLQQRVAEYPTTGIMLNPIDWAGMETLKDAQGRYIWGMPQGVGTPIMWGVPIIETNAIPAGHFLLGNFDMAAQIFDREAPNVMLSTEDNVNFQKNLVTMRAEERLALVVYRPQAIVYGAFSAT